MKLKFELKGGEPSEAEEAVEEEAAAVDLLSLMLPSLVVALLPLLFGG